MCGVEAHVAHTPDDSCTLCVCVSSPLCRHYDTNNNRDGPPRAGLGLQDAAAVPGGGRRLGRRAGEVTSRPDMSIEFRTGGPPCYCSPPPAAGLSWGLVDRFFREKKGRPSLPFPSPHQVLVGLTPLSAHERTNDPNATTTGDPAAVGGGALRLVRPRHGQAGGAPGKQEREGKHTRKEAIRVIASSIPHSLPSVIHPPTPLQQQPPQVICAFAGAGPAPLRRVVEDPLLLREWLDLRPQKLEMKVGE